MSVVAANLAWAGASGEARFDSREYTAVYRVQTDDKYDQAQTILSYFSVVGPYVGFIYQYGNDIDIAAVCDSIRPTRVSESAYYWDVEFHYATSENEEGEDEDGKKTGNPLNFRDEIDVGQTSITRTAEQAWREGGFVGQAAAKYPIGSFGDVVNSAGVPFNPTLEKEHKQHVYRITKHMANYPANHDALLMHLNKNVWTINKPNYNFTKTIQKWHGQLLALNASFDVQTQGNNVIRYWKVTYEILHDPVYPLIDEPLDRGITRRAALGDPDGRGGLMGFKGDGSAMNALEYAAQIPPGVPERMRIRDPFGDPITEPVNLNGDGQPLKEGQAPVWLKYRKYPDADLTVLNL